MHYAGLLFIYLTSRWHFLPSRGLHAQTMHIQEHSHIKSTKIIKSKIFTIFVHVDNRHWRECTLKGAKCEHLSSNCCKSYLCSFEVHFMEGFCPLVPSHWNSVQRLDQYVRLLRWCWGLMPPVTLSFFSWHRSERVRTYDKDSSPLLLAFSPC